MKTDFNFENAKVGDKVYHYRKGWTFLTEVKSNYISVDNDVNNFYPNGNLFPLDLNPTIYPYNPFENNQERVVEVLDSQQGWIKRELIKITTENKAICWDKHKVKVFLWSNWREIEPQKELTQEEKINILWEKYGK